MLLKVTFEGRVLRKMFWPKRDEVTGGGGKDCLVSSLSGRIILNWNLKESDGEAWTGMLWLRIETGGGRL